MKKSKAITWLSIVSFVLLVMLFVTFVRFPVGIYNFNSVLGAIKTDYDISGGKTYTLTLAEDNNEEVENINSVISTLENRLEVLGYSSYSVTAFKLVDEGVEDYDIRISVKSTDSIESDIKTIASYGTIKFYGDATEDPTTEIMTDGTTIADSQYIGEQANEDGSTSYVVSLVFTDYAYDALTTAIKSATSGENSGSFYLKITLGEETILSSQFSESSMTNKTVYVNTTSEAAAKQMALTLRTGGLAYKYEVSESETITPLFGENTELKLIIAFAVLYLALFIGFAVAFKGYGLISILTMLSFIVMQLGLMIAVPGIILSATGVIALLISTILMVDGLILTIKRVKEEYAIGKTVKAAVKVGFKRALIPNVNIVVISVVTSLLAFALTGGLLQGFGVLAIGCGVAFVSVVLIFRMFTSLILPLVDKKETFLNLKREEV